jgi:peptidoglycan/xylan/chitin deacetylase (PgdA/CDA1 family)
MFLKRVLILAGGVILCLAVFVVYIEVAHYQMEERFRAEREKFHLDHLTLTAANAVTPAPAAPPVAPSTSDTNALIGPVPPAPTATDSSAPATPTPDSGTASPAPSAPDTNATPTAPAMPNAVPAPSGDSNNAPAAPTAPSTYNFPGGVSLFQVAAFRPGLTALVIGQTASPAAAPAPAPAPATIDASGGTSGKGKVIVLLYHQFKPAGVAIPSKFQWTMNVDVFESEMKYIHDNGYKVVPMSDVLKFLRHEITLPSNCVCITIDDGYKSAIDYAAPILKQYNYPWTFFVYPEFIASAENHGSASWNDLLQLQADGVDIECHSMTHPNLKLHRVKGRSLSPDEYAAFLKNETSGAKALLEQKMGRPITCFAYPYGEYNKQVEQAAIDAGFDAIFTVADNPVYASTSLHSIGRYTITQGVEKNFTAYLRQGALELTSADPSPGATISNPQPIITATLGYPGRLDPNSIETSVRDFGDVKHDFDPATNTLRLYLPRPLISPVVLVNLRVRDAKSGQVMVANWHFNYEPAAGATTHAPISAGPASASPVAPAPAPTPAPTVSTTPPVVPSAPAPAPAPTPLPHTD